MFKKKDLLRKTLALLILFSGFIFDGFGQSNITPEKGLQFYRQAKAAGLSDEEIRNLALQNGLTQSEYLELQKQLFGEVSDNVLSDYQREMGSLRESVNIPVDPPSPVTQDTMISTLELFGSQFFSQSGITFEPNIQIPTPNNYVLGPGDELLVDISGNAVKNYKVQVTPEGTITLANFPPLLVAGLTMEDVKSQIISRLRNSYSGPGIHINVSLGKIRSIRITVTGEAVHPGTYTVSSLATAFHALYVSGGPSVNGTLREIEVIRNNKSIRKIDFYKFLIHGDVSDNILLQDQDIIFIKPSQSLVTLTGELKRPGIYEMKEGETLRTAIQYAGGFTSEAYSKRISLLRNTGREYELDQIGEDLYETFSLKNGDRFTVGRILDRFANRVIIKGAVYRAGEYPINQKIRTVRQLIEEADGLTEDAFLNRAVLYRLNEFREPVALAIDLRKLLSGEIDDIRLQRDDIVEIKSIQDLQEESPVFVHGEVRSPGKYLFRYGMTIGDLIFEAGGYTQAAAPYRIEVSRRVKYDTLDLPSSQNIRVYRFELSDNLELSNEERNFTLEPYDHVFIRNAPRYESQKMFAVLGQVKYPGNYAVIQSVDRISDAIQRAGGLKETAFISAAQFKRKGETIALNLQSILENPNQSSNLLLQQGDSLFIPEKQETVKLIGAVLNPSSVNFDPRYNVKDYLSQAGGYTDSANKKKLYVTHPNGITERTKHFLFFRSYPKVTPGSHIVVPLKEVDPNKQTWTRGERIMLISSVTTISVTLVRVLQEIWSKN